MKNSIAVRNIRNGKNNSIKNRRNTGMVRQFTIVMFLIVSLLITGCNRSATNEVNQNQAEPVAKASQSEPGKITFPFDFPKVDTLAATGETVLVPSYNWIEEASNGEADRVTMIWYSNEFVKKGDTNSEVKFLDGVKSVPNPYIIPIPPGGTAKKGDIVLTWWQTGSGMQRAIVTDATNASQPKVRYLDLDYDNPAEDSTSKKSIAQTDYPLAADSFFPLEVDFAPGTSILFGEENLHGQVIRASDEKLFIRLFAGKINVIEKSKATPIPIKPEVKEGDQVKAINVGRFYKAEVVKIDETIGRVWVKFEDSEQEVVVAFGDLIKD